MRLWDVWSVPYEGKAVLLAAAQQVSAGGVVDLLSRFRPHEYAAALLAQHTGLPAPADREWRTKGTKWGASDKPKNG